MKKLTLLLSLIIVSCSSSDEEFEVYLEERAQRLGIKLDEIKKNARVDDLRRELEEDRMFSELMKTAEIKEETV